MAHHEDGEFRVVGVYQRFVDGKVQETGMVRANRQEDPLTCCYPDNGCQCDPLPTTQEPCQRCAGGKTSNPFG